MCVCVYVKECVYEEESITEQTLTLSGEQTEVARDAHPTHIPLLTTGLKISIQVK